MIWVAAVLFVVMWTSIEFELGGQTARLHHVAKSGEVTIDLDRANTSPERLWSANTCTRSVNETEYETIFRK